MKSLLVFFVTLFFTFCVFAQNADELLLSYKRDFALSDLAKKTEIITEAGKTGADFSSLYYDALRYAVSNALLLKNDADLIKLTQAALEALQKSSTQVQVSLLWEAFSLFADQKIRSQAIDLIVQAKTDVTESVARLNTYIQTETAKKSAERQNTVFESAITALGKIASPASFTVLFNVLLSDSSVEIKKQALISLNNITSGYDKNILAIVTGDFSVFEKLTALRAAAKNDNINAKIRGEISEKALLNAINTTEGASPSETVETLRKEALEQIALLKYTPAAQTVIKYFTLAAQDFKNGRMNAASFIPIINCLGEMQTADASQVLSWYLATLNSQAELNGTFNEQVVISVINALGTLGDKSAFDNLLYVSYIQNYPESVINASRSALEKLKW